MKNINRDEDKEYDEKEMKLNNIIVIITIIFWIIVILCDIFIKEFDFINGLKNEDFISYLIALFLVGFTAKSLFHLFFVISGKFVKKYDDKDLRFDINFFRNDLGKVNPSYVYYIINSDIDIKKTVSAEILKLIKDRYIIKENDKYLKTDKDILLLSKSQKMVYNYVINNEIIDEYLYSNTVKKEMKEKGYINNIYDKQLIDKAVKYVAASIFLSPIAGGLSVLSYSIAERTNNDILIFIGSIPGILVMIAIVFMFIFPVVAIIYDKYKIKFTRTNKGKELLYKSLGLKKFLEEFSNIEDKKIEELDIREYYLIYSLIFGLNDDEVNKVINEKNF